MTGGKGGRGHPLCCLFDQIPDRTGTCTRPVAPQVLSSCYWHARPPCSHGVFRPATGQSDRVIRHLQHSRLPWCSSSFRLRSFKRRGVGWEREGGREEGGGGGREIGTRSCCAAIQNQRGGKGSRREEGSITGKERDGPVSQWDPVEHRPDRAAGNRTLPGPRPGHSTDIPTTGFPVMYG